jgi:hypothetical protein
MEDVAAPVRTKYIRVTNGLDVPFTDMHDGVPITIAPGKSDTFPVDMAAHFFGYHDDVTTEAMFRHTSRRQGWNTPFHVKPDEATGKQLARVLFDKLTIEPVFYRMVEEKVDTTQPIPADDGSGELPAMGAMKDAVSYAANRRTSGPGRGAA